MERRVKYSANEVVDDKFSSRPGGDFFRFPIPVYKHSLYPNSTEQDGKNRWVGTIPADEPAPDHDAVDATTLSGDALAQALVGPGAEEDPADTHLKHVAQMFFAAHTWIGGPDMPNSRALMWFVRVDPSFVPEAGVSGRGYVYGVELRNSRLKPARDNQYKLYILLCLMVELGAVEINPVSRRMYEARVRQDGGGVDIAWKGDWGCDAEDWDSRLLVDLACTLLLPLPGRSARPNEHAAVTWVPWLLGRYLTNKTQSRKYGTQSSNTTTRRKAKARRPSSHAPSSSSTQTLKVSARSRRAL
ncbi:hypothetical protein PMIN05_008907 [Paraphaeosphaeria minitans]